MAVREPPDSSDVGRLKRLEALDELLPMLSGVLDVREVFARISEMTKQVLPHDIIGITLLEPDGIHATVHALATSVTPQGPKRIVFDSPEMIVTPWDHKIVDDTQDDPVERERPAAKAGIRSVLRLPLREGGRFIGIVGIGSLTPRSYTESDVSVGRRIAALVQLAISHTRLAEERERMAKLRERAANLEVLDGLLKTLTGVLSLRDVIDRVSDIAQKVIAHDAMTVIIPTEDPAVAKVYAVRGFGDQPDAQTTRLRGADRLMRGSWDHQIIDDLAADPEYADSVSVRIGLRSALLVAIHIEGSLYAITSFQSRTVGAFSKDDVLLARRIADHMALALSHERLAEEQRRNEELRARSATMEMLDEVLSAVTGSGELPVVWDRISAVSQKVLPHDALLLAALLPDRVRGRVYASKTPGSAAFAEIVSVPPAVINNPDWEHDLVEDLQTQEDQKNLESTRLGYRSALRIPLRLDGEFVAAVSFMSFTPKAYSLADVQTARRIGDRLVQSFARERRLALRKQVDEAAERTSRLEARVRELTDELDSRTGYRRVIGESAKWREVLMQATQVASTDTTALLLGESGTGKEVVARFLHRASQRKNGPFVALNCAALPEQLLEAELFGYERGAFTGAVNSKPGQLEQAGGGTLFLDEVGEMSLPAQAKFLRVLQEREFQRLGGTRVLKTDTRIVAATNRDLQKAIQLGQFREDLFYRLNVFAIHLPPLRERRDDVLALSEAFLKEIGRSIGRPPAGISRDAREQLLGYHWPGNVRELRNILERAAILCEGGLITTGHLTLSPPPAKPQPQPIAAAPLPAAAAAVPPPAPSGDLQSVERAMIEQALKDARYNKSKAAKQLGLTRTQLYVRLRRYGLE
jgi:transcriptional regulator with GAF, ATPase, and Fis domain